MCIQNIHTEHRQNVVRIKDHRRVDFGTVGLPTCWKPRTCHAKLERKEHISCRTGTSEPPNHPKPTFKKRFQTQPSTNHDGPGKVGRLFRAIYLSTRWAPESPGVTKEFIQPANYGCTPCNRLLSKLYTNSGTYIKSIHLSMYVSMYLCIYVCMYLCIYVSMYLCMYVSMYVCIYVSTYVRMFMNVFM